MLVGRDPHVARIAGLLDAVRPWYADALLLVGDAGMGKGALSDEARARAGGRVLAARRRE